MSKISVSSNMRPAYAWMTKAPPKAEREMLATVAQGFDSDLAIYREHVHDVIGAIMGRGVDPVELWAMLGNCVVPVLDRQ